MNEEDFKRYHCNSEYQTEDEIKISFYRFKISELKIKLSQTDYKAIKYAEGLYTDEEYLPIKEERQECRDKINEYEELIKELENES